ncbi:hypothetical protein [Streptomyces sp. NPDC002057]|uniref:hypothetical protein n=1 Tax=Streptomyces sp. NPDC002057 TaxID=3154664 RepID=UPI00332BC242
MNDFAQTLERQHLLQRSLEARLGRPADWPLKIQAAYLQLQTLQQLIGDDYTTFIDRAQRAVEERRGEDRVGTSQVRRERLGRLLFGDSHQLPDTLQIAWATNFGLEVLLDNREYEIVIDAAAEAASVVAA